MSDLDLRYTASVTRLVSWHLFSGIGKSDNRLSAQIARHRDAPLLPHDLGRVD
jgi:hypothetical protein